MRLLEIVEDGGKVQIVLEEMSHEDVRAVHDFQIRGGEGRLVIGDGGICNHPED